MKTYQTFSSTETKRLGEKLGKNVLSKNIRRSKAALVFALKGDLGAGKTTFVQGFFKGLGLKKRAPSPTFIIMRRHSLKRRVERKIVAHTFTNIFHVDAYRLKNTKHFGALGFKEILADPANIILIEWAERAKKLLPKHAIWVTFTYGKRENERRIMMK